MNPQQISQAHTSNKKRAKFWLIAPAASIVVGLMLGGLNQLTTAGSAAHTTINLLSFLLIAPAGLALIPGLIYGLSLLNKK